MIHPAVMRTDAPATPFNTLFPPPRPRSFYVAKGAIERPLETGLGPRPRRDIWGSYAGAVRCTSRPHNGGDVNWQNGTAIAHPPQDARDGASRHAHPRSLDVELGGFEASGAWWSSKSTHANGVPFIFNLVGSGSDHPVNSRYRYLRDALAKRELSRAGTRRRHGTPRDPRPRSSPA